MTKPASSSRLSIIIIIGVAILIIAAILTTLSAFNKAARERTTNTTQTNTVSDTIDTAIVSELVILHRGQSVKVDKFSVSLNLLELGDSTKVMVIDQTTQSVLGQVQFSQVGEIQVLPGYQLRLVNATTDAVQIIIGRVQ